MRMVVKRLINVTRKKIKKSVSQKSNFIFYKIVEFSQENLYYTLQCINTNAIFQARISEIVFDADLLQGLHPTQACFIGMEYAGAFKKVHFHEIFDQKKLRKLNKSLTCRYGRYRLCYQDRKGNICCKCRKTHEKFTMDPRDIALSEKLIQEFDAMHAFHIGLSAGLKVNNLIEQSEIRPVSRPLLRIIK